MIWITGKNGMLARLIQHHLAAMGLSFIATCHHECPLEDHSSIQAYIQQYQPRIILNCAAFTMVDKAEKAPLLALESNSLALHHLVELSQSHAIRLIHFSTDYIFDGAKNSPYVEIDSANPLNLYGYSKYLGELALRNHPNYLVIRLAWLYTQERGFVPTILEKAKQLESMDIVEDEIGSPSYLPLLIEPITQIAMSLEQGVIHCASQGAVSRYELATHMLQLANQAKLISHIPKIHAISTQEFLSRHPTLAKRPNYSALDSSKAAHLVAPLKLGSWQEHLEYFIQEKLTY